MASQTGSQPKDEKNVITIDVEPKDYYKDTANHAPILPLALEQNKEEVRNLDLETDKID